MSVEIPQLASELTMVLGPFLPYLVGAGKKAAEEFGKKIGSATWDTAQRLWQKIGPRMEQRPAAREALADVANNPQDADALAALRLQLKKLLAEDDALACEVARMWEAAKAAGVSVTASGNRSVAIGGDASGNIIITGDNNEINE